LGLAEAVEIPTAVAQSSMFLESGKPTKLWRKKYLEKT
jgi:hypothetical protein